MGFFLLRKDTGAFEFWNLFWKNIVKSRKYLSLNVGTSHFQVFLYPENLTLM